MGKTDPAQVQLPEMKLYYCACGCRTLIRRNPRGRPKKCVNETHRKRLERNRRKWKLSGGNDE